MIMCFPPSGYQHGRADNRKSCILNGERLLYAHVTLSRHGICDVKFYGAIFFFNAEINVFRISKHKSLE